MKYHFNIDVVRCRCLVEVTLVFWRKLQRFFVRNQPGMIQIYFIPHKYNSGVLTSLFFQFTDEFDELLCSLKCPWFIYGVHNDKTFVLAEINGFILKLIPKKKLWQEPKFFLHDVHAVTYCTRCICDMQHRGLLVNFIAHIVRQLCEDRSMNWEFSNTPT